MVQVIKNRPLGRFFILCYSAAMKYLGIDYGTKRTGVAISDESGKFAFPKTILSTGKQFLAEIVEMVQKEGVEKIVVGNSMTMSGERNAIMEDIDAFIEELYKLTGVPVDLEDERFSSSAVRSFDWSKPVATPHRSGKTSEPIDDRAAAVMLQRYLDKQS